MAALYFGLAGINEFMNDYFDANDYSGGERLLSILGIVLVVLAVVGIVSAIIGVISWVRTTSQQWQFAAEMKERRQAKKAAKEKAEARTVVKKKGK